MGERERGEGGGGYQLTNWRAEKTFDRVFSRGMPKEQKGFRVCESKMN
jgi:hypothetical protein